MTALRLCWDVSSQIFHFSLTEEDMKALKGLDRKWKACLLDEWVNTLCSQRLWACRRRVKLSSLFLLTILLNSFFCCCNFSRSVKSHPYYPFVWGSRLKTTGSLSSWLTHSDATVTALPSNEMLQHWQLLVNHCLFICVKKKKNSEVSKRMFLFSTQQIHNMFPPRAKYIKPVSIKQVSLRSITASF